jgi:hypothetical protein
MNKNKWVRCPDCNCNINPVLAMCTCGYRLPPKEYALYDENLQPINLQQKHRDPTWKEFRSKIVKLYGEEIAKKHLDPYKDCKSCELAMEAIRKLPNSAFKNIGLKFCENVKKHNNFMAKSQTIKN